MHVIAHMRAPTECARTQRKNRTAFLPLTQTEAGAAAAVPLGLQHGFLPRIRRMHRRFLARDRYSAFRASPRGLFNHHRD